MDPPAPVQAAPDSGEHQALDAEIKLYVQIRNNFQDVELVYKRLKNALEQQRDSLFNTMETQGFKTVNHDLGRFTRTEKLKCQVTDVKAARDALAEDGLLDEMTRTEWHKANLNRLVKDALEAGDELPAGLESITERGITYTRPEGDPRKAKRS